MNLETGLKTAMTMELKIRDIYVQAFEKCSDEAGRRFFAMMRDDEQYHHDYLDKRLKEWEQSGDIQYQDIKMNVPIGQQIKACIQDVQKAMTVEDRGVIQQLLSNALKGEVLTSEFYEKLVADSDGQVKKMFARFLEIENGHIAAVQAELDYVMNTGYWFDFKEFDME
jgi:rubrerythrin